MIIIIIILIIKTTTTKQQNKLIIIKIITKITDFISSGVKSCSCSIDITTLYSAYAVVYLHEVQLGIFCKVCLHECVNGTMHLPT